MRDVYVKQYGNWVDYKSMCSLYNNNTIQRKKKEEHLEVNLKLICKNIKEKKREEVSKYHNLLMEKNSEKCTFVYM